MEILRSHLIFHSSLLLHFSSHFLILLPYLFHNQIISYLLHNKSTSQHHLNNRSLSQYPPHLLFWMISLPIPILMAPLYPSLLTRNSWVIVWEAHHLKVTLPSMTMATPIIPQTLLPISLYPPVYQLRQTQQQSQTKISLHFRSNLQNKSSKLASSTFFWPHGRRGREPT